MQLLYVDAKSIDLDINSIAQNTAKELTCGNCIALTNFFTTSEILLWRRYLSNLGRCQMPNYDQIKFGMKNNHRLNFDDDRSAVRGYFHQFNFFDWNQDLIDIFSRTDLLFNFKKTVSTLMHRNTIESSSPQNDQGTNSSLINRVSFQYYPRSKGYLKKHRDPLNSSQSIVPTIVMSEYGKDYFSGGFYLDHNGEYHYPERNLSLGDILIFNPHCPHGVERIDQEYVTDSIISEYLSQAESLPGRWMGLITTTLPSDSPMSQGVTTK